MSGNSRASYSSLRQCSLRCATATVMTHRVLSCAFQAVRHCQPARIANGRTLRMSYVAPSKWEYALMQVCRWLAISLRSVQGELLRRRVLVAMPPWTGGCARTRSRMPDKVAVSSCGSCTKASNRSNPPRYRAVSPSLSGIRTSAQGKHSRGIQGPCTATLRIPTPWPPAPQALVP